ncbi:MAG TPA: response regulator transcription factor [Chloroflexi bacterium]|nr:response regulator transcription factor [Chloroflexota bacterium]
MGNGSRRVLVVGNTPPVQNLCERLLEAGFEATPTKNASDARRYIERYGLPHLMIVALHPPDMEGLKLCQELYDVTGLPIITLSSSPSTDMAIRALQYADDYVREPFEEEELIMRIRRVLSRIQDFNYAAAPTLKVCDWLTFDYTRREINVKGHVKKLTPTENAILRILVSHEGQVVDNETLIERVWRADPIAGNENTLRVHVHRLRHKIENDPPAPRVIFTKRGLGYMFQKV